MGFPLTQREKSYTHTHTHTHTHTRIEKETRNRQDDILEETKVTGSSNGMCLDIYADFSPPLFFKNGSREGQERREEECRCD